MRQDQFEKLLALQTKLIDALIEEADPDGWPGAGIAAAAMDKGTRGDRYWCKKNAAATAMLEARIAARIGTERALAKAGEIPEPPPPSDTPPTDDDFESEISRFETEAAQQLARFRAKSGGRT